MKQISDMNKEEFITYRVTEKNTDQNEIVELWDKFEKELAAKGVTGADLIDKVKRRLTSHYIQTDKYPIADYEAVIIGVVENDYGARKQYFKAKEQFKANAQQAIAEGLTDAQGNPLYQKGFNKGSVITAETAINRGYMGAFKGKNDRDYIKGITSSRYSLFDKVPPMNSIIKFKASMNPKTTSSNYVLNITKNTTFEVVKVLSDVEYENFIKTYFSENLLDMEKLDEYYETNKTNYERMVIIRGDVYSLISDDPTRTKVDTLSGKTTLKNSIIGLNKRNSTVSVKCIGSPLIELNCDEYSQDVTVIGQPRKGNDGELTIAMYGAYIPEKQRIAKEKYVVPETKEQLADNDW